MTLITLKFSPEMEELIMQGRKICTTRLEQKGEVGDCFVIRDRLYRIIEIDTEIDLNYSMALYYRQEGFEYESEYFDALRSYYPDISEPDIVAVHFFAYVCDICQDFNRGCNSCIPEYCPASEVCNHDTRNRD